MDPDERDRLARLAVAAQQGDVEAYGRIVELTEAAVHAAVRRVVDDPHEAEDLAQEAFLRAYRALGGLRDPRALVAWLQRIARDVALNHLRARRRSFVDPVEVERLAPSALEDEDLEQASLARAMVTLPTEDRRLCERYYHGGWTMKRLAEDLGLTEAAVRKRLQRVRDRLRREMTMSTTELPRRIVELLSVPDLTALPENPVGALWTEFRRHHEGWEVVELPERLQRGEVEAVYGGAAPERLAEYLGYLERQDWLRPELTVSLLIAARQRGGARRLVTTGKVYRLGDAEGATRLLAFHQAEALWIEEGLDEWQAMGSTVGLVERLSGGGRLRITQVEYQLYSRRGWEVDVEWPGQGWSGVCGMARYADEVTERLGHNPSRCAAAGLGVGLDRLACLRYGIDDIRKVAAARV
ncbi:MAG: sigma-70 family RNA polymerase sigma factor [Candidatus Latescibacterota bacterium]